MVKETYLYGKRDLYMAKETYPYGKRDLHMAKETYRYDKRDLYMTKETYLYGKRGLLRLAYQPAPAGDQDRVPSLALSVWLLPSSCCCAWRRRRWRRRRPCSLACCPRQRARGLVQLLCDARSTPPRIAAVCIVDGIQYADMEPTAEVLKQFQQRGDNQIASLELLAVAFGEYAGVHKQRALNMCVCRLVDI